MSTPLPASIEAHLKEAGFTATELLVLKKLLEEEALTVREIAAKTAKSTGIIDQAIKKMLSRGVVARSIINDQPRYHLLSLDALIRLLNQDRASKQLALERRQKNFEAFIATVTANRSRPDMEYFEGEEGIKTAYHRLLEQKKEMLAYAAITCKEEDDPLRTLRLDLFRQRRKQNIFLRNLATDSSLARRFQSRDHFEYRQTKLLPESELFIPFEKIIVGDIVACIDSALQKACFIRYPEMAHAERGMFEKLWSRQSDSQTSGQEIVAEDKHATFISLKTKIASYLRTLVLNKNVFSALCALLVFSLVISFGLYKYTVYLNLQRIRDKVTSIAATGALEIDPLQVEAVHTRIDIKKPEYASLVKTLFDIREQNSNVRAVYVMRSTANKNTVEFVAEADSLDPDHKEDYNHDGTIDSADENIAPGEKYDVTNQPELRDRWYATGPISTPVPETDQWGTFVSGLAPIFNDKNEVVGVLGVDIPVETIYVVHSFIFLPAFFALILIVFYIVLRVYILRFNRTL